MKNISLIFTIIFSVATFANTSSDRYSEEKSLTEVIEFIQDNLSYSCGVEIKSKRKTILDCKTDYSKTRVTVKTEPGVEDFNEKVREIRIKFLNDEEGDYSIVRSLEGLQNRFSYVCGMNKMKRTIRGKIKTDWNCNVRGLGDLVVEMKMNPSEESSERFEELSITFK